MDLRFDPADVAFGEEVRAWLEEQLADRYAHIRGRGGPGDEHSCLDERRVWERELAENGWTCLGWPKAYGGQEMSLVRQMIFHEEYARARGPGRIGHIGEQLLGPTLIDYGSDAQKAEFLPSIGAAETLWCQGYSEPNAGSDLANVQTRAELDGDEWVITGQKIWTSHAHWADWCFAICRTDPEVPRHRGLSYILLPMRQPGVAIRPIVQITATSEFSEVFFDGARARADHVVGGVGNGWKVAMATLMYERGVSTLGQQLNFRNELELITRIAKENGSSKRPSMRQRLSEAWMGIEIMRLHALRTLASTDGGVRAGLISKLYWANWHKCLGELAMDVLGEGAEVLEGPDYALSELQRMFLFSRADTIYAGTDEIQKNIIGERGLGLPREPRRS